MAHLTRKEVERRIAKGEALPDYVLVDYPDIARKYRIIPVEGNPSQVEKIKSHVKKHLSRDQKEYKKAYQEDEELKRWLEKNPSKYHHSKYTDRYEVFIRDERFPIASSSDRDHAVAVARVTAEKMARPAFVFDKEKGRISMETGGKYVRNSSRSHRYRKNAKGDLVLEDFEVEENPSDEYRPRLHKKRKGVYGRTERSRELYPKVRIENPKFTASQRRKYAKEGVALPDGSFPIRNRKDLMDALHDLGRTKNYARAQRHIIKRAKSLGLTADLSPEWVARKGRKRKNPHHGNIAAMKRGLSKHLNETFEQFKKRMIAKHGRVSEEKIRQWYNLRNAGAKALGLK